MRTRAAIVLVGASFAGLGALTFPAMPDLTRGGVAGAPTPPPAPMSGQGWGAWTQAAPVPDRSSDQGVPPASPAALPADAGIWATPAEFADSD